jgi:hypothetical protein
LKWENGEPVVVDETAKKSTTGLEEAFQGMGSAISQNLRDGLFAAFKDGKTRFAGVEDPVLVAAKKKLNPAKTDQAAFNKFIDSYTQAKDKAAKRAAANEERKRANAAAAALDKEDAALAKQEEELLRQSQGAKC